MSLYRRSRALRVILWIAFVIGGLLLLIRLVLDPLAAHYTLVVERHAPEPTAVAQRS